MTTKTRPLAVEPPRTPAPDTVAALDSVGQTLANLELYANMSDHERADINDEMHRKSAGNVGYGDMVADACESIRVRYAAQVKALEAADKLALQAGFWWQAASSAECVTNQGLVDALAAYRAAREVKP